MEDNQYWNRLNSAFSRFALDEMKEMSQSGNALVNSAVGNELEWCGSQTLLFMTADLFVSHNKIMELESTIKALQTRLIHEDNATSLLKKQLAAAEDGTWALQEKLSRTSAQNDTLLEVNMNQQMKLKELNAGQVPQEIQAGLMEARHRIKSLETELATQRNAYAQATGDKENSSHAQHMHAHATTRHGRTLL